ncbi:hypothetical protein OYT1_ch1624 [Ferriphaselus amnicola]|uniref:Uncharacterized protein n=1 Tax=Ferriphaselus amnicola TaxID=1188319 RepID=A0A2Z6GC27_9PROT|nr:hypothetical protein [Ferriphaselus amnicola]BBE51171.1 hypothetical protein OYT1_ch1624 [Ferriphaselus amnicola]
MSYQLTEQSFLKDVADHQMHVLMDNGVYRHIRFKQPDTGCYHFDLITYPGYLVYSGDMGCYVFSRLDDMFQFFRTDRCDFNYNSNGLSINLGYWSEKLRAVDGNRSNAGVTELDEDRIRQVINEYRLSWVRSYRHKLDKDNRRWLWEDVESHVLASDNAEEMLRSAYSFSEWVGGHNFCFDDLWDHDFTKYTHHFLWCCYALAWGIQQYDKMKASEVSA